MQAVDLLLDKLEPISAQAKVIRVGLSHSRPDLNKKFALHQVQKNEPEGAAKVQAQLEEAQIVVAATSSLR